MRLFIVLAAILVSIAVYDIGGKPAPWNFEVAMLVAVVFAAAADYKERRRQ